MRSSNQSFADTCEKTIDKQSHTRTWVELRHAQLNTGDTHHSPDSSNRMQRYTHTPPKQRELEQRAQPGEEAGTRMSEAP